MKPIVVGMSGKMGVGKNFISEAYIVPKLIQYVEDTFNDIRLVPSFFSFGSFIKSELYARDAHLTFDSLFQAKTKDVRARLQAYGTEVGRQSIHKNIWVRHVDLWMQIQMDGLAHLNAITTPRTGGTHAPTVRYVPLYIIQDIRFENELALVKSFEWALVVRVEADDRHTQRVQLEQSNAQHVSETALDSMPFEYVLDNRIDRPETSLRQDVDTIVASFTTRKVFKGL